MMLYRFFAHFVQTLTEDYSAEVSIYCSLLLNDNKSLFPSTLANTNVKEQSTQVQINPERIYKHLNSCKQTVVRKCVFNKHL